MKFVLILILLIGACGAADYYGQINVRPGASIEMDSTTPGDIDMNGGSVNNASNLAGVMAAATIYKSGDSIYVTDQNRTHAYIGGATTDDVAALEYAFANYAIVSLDFDTYYIDSIVDIDHSVEIFGNGAIFKSAANSTYFYVNNATSPTVIFHNINYDGNKNEYTGTHFLYATGDTYVYNCVIHDTHGYGLGPAFGGDMSVIDTTIYDCGNATAPGYNGILSQDGGQLTVENCDISGSSEHGIYAADANSAGNGTETYIRKCRIHDNLGNGIQARGLIIRIIDNEIYDNVGYGLNCGGGDIAIIHNNITNGATSTLSAIRIAEDDSVEIPLTSIRIAENSINSSGVSQQHGISTIGDLAHLKYCGIFENDIYNSGYCGISLNHIYGITIIESNYINNSGTYSAGVGHGILINGALDYPTIANNIIDGIGGTSYGIKSNGDWEYIHDNRIIPPTDDILGAVGANSTLTDNVGA